MGNGQVPCLCVSLHRVALSQVARPVRWLRVVEAQWVSTSADWHDLVDLERPRMPCWQLVVDGPPADGARKLLGSPVQAHLPPCVAVGDPRVPLALCHGGWALLRSAPNKKGHPAGWPYGSAYNLVHGAVLWRPIASYISAIPCPCTQRSNPIASISSKACAALAMHCERE